MNSKKTPQELYKIAREFEKKNKNLIIGDIIGVGGYGLVVDIKKPYNSLVGKLIKKEINDETNLILEFKGPNIVKINKIYSENIKLDNIEEKYHFILMEKAYLKDLKNFNRETYKNGILKLIIKSPFEGVISDNLIKYYCYEIIKGFESLERSDYSHFDIKPDNILIFFNLIMKLSDFSLLRNPNKIKTNNGKIRIPGGTPGYLSPEYFENSDVSYDVAKKQDYFALGSTIYYLKYGEPMLKSPIYENDGEKTSDSIIDLLQRAMDNIKSKKLSDQDFIDFLCSLINYKPDDRPIFEEIYRNKWLNKNIDKIMEFYKENYTNEEKLIMELNKSDYLIRKKSELNKDRKKFNFNKNNFKKNNLKKK